jgi:hypothetical protein
LDEQKIKIDGDEQDYYKKIWEDLTKGDGFRELFEDMKMFQISQLSLQQAVDLACLLMRLEVDFQSYTRNIPTVGGIVKLATIDENGFKWLSGRDVSKPKYIRKK